MRAQVVVILDTGHHLTSHPTDKKTSNIVQHCNIDKTSSKKLPCSPPKEHNMEIVKINESISINGIESKFGTNAWFLRENCWCNISSDNKDFSINFFNLFSVSKWRYIYLIKVLSKIDYSNNKPLLVWGIWTLGTFWIEHLLYQLIL